MNKPELRKLYLAKRRQLSAAEHAERSSRVADHFFSANDLDEIGSILCFISLTHTGEIETSHIFEKLWQSFPSIKTYAPRVDHAESEMNALPFTRQTRLAENKWKLIEPAEGSKVDPKEIDLVLVPLLAVDTRGYRVGYGKGFYDRFLMNCRPDCVKVGLSLFPPIEPIDDVHDGDIPLDSVVTPDGLILPIN